MKLLNMLIMIAAIIFVLQIIVLGIASIWTEDLNQVIASGIWLLVLLIIRLYKLRRN